VRRLLVLVSSIIFVDAMLFGALTPLIPGYAEEFELSKAGAGLLAAAFGAGALVGGLPGGLAALHVGPKRTVVLGLTALAVASFAFALAGDAWTLGLARFLQGASSTITWAGALAWLTVQAPRERRGQVIGTAFGAAVLGAILGPMFGAVADLVGVRGSFAAVGSCAIALALWAAANPGTAPEPQRPDALGRAGRDARFLGGLWLNTLPAMLFGVLTLLAPLRLDEAGFGALAIGSVFLAAGVVEVVLNPIVGRYSDRVGRLLPTRVALAASVVVAAMLAAAEGGVAVTLLVCAAAVSFGSFYTPGMALVSDRAEAAGLAQGLAFGVMNSAWALGNMTGPAVGGLLAEQFGDALPFAVGSVLCLLTLLAAERLARTPARISSEA
jgi:predicted MFS family arabinose efflux permease